MKFETGQKVRIRSKSAGQTWEHTLNNHPALTERYWIIQAIYYNYFDKYRNVTHPMVIMVQDNWYLPCDIVLDYHREVDELIDEAIASMEG